MTVQVVLNEIDGELYAGLSVVDPPHPNDQFVMEILGDYLTPELSGIIERCKAKAG